jgi:hypothetical protein
MTTTQTHAEALIIGRSQVVLDTTVEILADRGFVAHATNDFAAITEQVDASRLGVVVLGGQVPPDTKAEIQAQISAVNDGVLFVQGLSGIPGLIADQVAIAFAGEQLIPGQAPRYDAEQRAIELRLYAPLDVEVTVYWITALIPPDPKSASLVLQHGRLPAGDHAFAVPDAVALDAAFATVRAGAAAWSFRLG